MTETLSEMFQESNGQPILVAGKLVRTIYERSVSPGAFFSIKRLAHSHKVVQGLRIKCNSGKLEVNGQSIVDVILWADTSPAEVTIKVVGKSETTVKFWNVWRFAEIMQAWVGNAGICIEENGSTVRLECSDGIGEPDFDDLVVEVDFGR